MGLIDYPMRRLRYEIANNLRQPKKGLFGWFVMNYVFKRKNKYLERNAVKLCQIEPHHNALEVGFGAGCGLEAAHECIQDGPGSVAGVDLSTRVVDQAMSLFRSQIESGKMNVMVSNVRLLPFQTDSFDRVFHCNSYYFWPPFMRSSCAELYRVLKPNGAMVTTINLKSIQARVAKGYLAMRDVDPLTYMLCLEDVGFRDVRMEYLQDSDTGQEFQAIFAHVHDKDKVEPERDLTASDVVRNDREDPLGKPL